MHKTLTGTHDSVGKKYFTSHVHTQKKEVTLTLEPNSHTLSPLLANMHAVSCSHACTNTHVRTVKLKLSVCRSVSLPRANTPTGCANAHLSLPVVGDAFLSWTQKKPNNSCTRDDSSFLQRERKHTAGLHYSATGRVTQQTGISVQQIPFCFSLTVAGNESNWVECFGCRGFVMCTNKSVRLQSDRL